MKHRLERVCEVVKRELSEIIVRDITFKDVLVTVQEVDVTPDLKQAHVFVSVLGAEAAKHAAMAQLHDHRKSLQSALSKRVVLKYTPQLHFEFDTALERGTRVINLLEQIDIPDGDPAPDPDEK